MNNKRNIYIVDKLVTGYNHVIFNSAIISIIAAIYKNHDVIFISESVHADVIASKNGFITNLKYQPYLEKSLSSSKVKRLIPWIEKKINDLFFINSLYKKSFKDASAVFFTCLSTTSLLYAGFKAKFLKIPAFFFLHGEIEFLFSEQISIVNKIKGGIYKIFLSQIGENSKVFVLSEIIKVGLVEAKYLPAEKIITIEHPIIPTNYCVKPISEKTIIFGHIGVALKKKSSELFFKLSKSHITAIAQKNVEFQLIGKILHNGISIEDTEAVKVISKDNKSLTQNVYEQSIADIDYAVFTFDENNYVYRASGSVMDAIAFTKPIIALKHSYFNYLFETAGNIGFLCNNLDELNHLLNRIIRKEKDLISQYKSQQENLRELMQKHSIDEIKNKLLGAYLEHV